LKSQKSDMCTKMTWVQKIAFLTNKNVQDSSCKVIINKALRILMGLSGTIEMKEEFYLEVVNGKICFQL
jgi:hypothetical protein